MRLKDIKEHWERSGRHFSGQGYSTPASRDPYLGFMEEEKIIKNLKSGWEALEIGCGDASHTIKYAACLKKIHALDISGPLLGRAVKNAVKARNLSFSLGSVLEIREILGGKKFDCVISQRCLINLPDWQRQKEAIRQVHASLKPDGVLLLSEGFSEGLTNLNKIRANLGLGRIVTAKYNKNLNRKKFVTFIKKYFRIIDVEDYGFYLFFSRTLHPLLVRPQEPRHSSRINEILYKLAAVPCGRGFHKYSYNLFYSLKKR